ncbi:MAG: hypothetical protein EZS28_043796, partial [Streblomastix strix]
MDEADYTPELIKHLRQRLLDFERERQIALFRFDDRYEIINKEYQIEKEVAYTEKETVDIQRVQDDIKLEEYEEKKNRCLKKPSTTSRINANRQVMKRLLESARAQGKDDTFEVQASHQIRPEKSHVSLVEQTRPFLNPST